MMTEVTFQSDITVSGARERVRAVFEEAFKKNLYLECDSQLIHQTTSGLDEEAKRLVKERGGIRQCLLGEEMRGEFSEMEGILFMTRDSDVIRLNVLDAYPTKESDGLFPPNAGKPRIISEATKRALILELTQANPRAPHPRRVTFRDPSQRPDPSLQGVTLRGTKVTQRSLSSCVSAAPFFPRDHRPLVQPNSFYLPPSTPFQPPSTPFQPPSTPFQPPSVPFQPPGPQGMSPLFSPASPLFSGIPIPSVPHQGGVWSPTVPGPNPERIVDSVLKGEELKEQLIAREELRGQVIAREELRGQLAAREKEVRRLEGRLEARERESALREEEVLALRDQLTQTQTQLVEAREQRERAQEEVEKRLELCREQKERLDELARERVEVSERAKQAERRVLRFHRDKAAENLQRELAELDKLAKWTELNPNTKAHALQLRAHTCLVQELLSKVCEQFQGQLEQLERGVPLAGLEYIASEVPSRPLPPVYLPAEREYPFVSSPPPLQDAGPRLAFAQPRYGPQTVSASPGQTDEREDAQTRLVRKLSNWHPELTETELFGYISQAKQARPGQSFSGMTLNEILSCVHDVISRERKYGAKQGQSTN